MNGTQKKAVRKKLYELFSAHIDRSIIDDVAVSCNFQLDSCITGMSVPHSLCADWVDI